MTHEEAFLQAVLEAPDDDTPRLMYADWLSERGNARGEFIRIQIEMERLDEFDSHRLPLELREVELLEQHGRRWAAPLGVPVRDCAFRRGFVERVRQAPSQFANLAERLFRRTPLATVQFVPEADFRRGTLAPLASCPHLGRLRGLDLTGLHFEEPLEEPGLVDFFRSPHLRELAHLSIQYVGDLTLRELTDLPALPSLRRFEISRTVLTGERVAAVAGWLPLNRVERLSLRVTVLEDSGLRHLIEALAGRSAAPLYLDLQQNRLRSVGRLAASPALKRLTHLDVSNNQDLGPGGAESLAQSANLSALRSLDLTASGLGNMGLQALADSPHLVSLSRLRLGRNEIGDAGLTVLVDSPLLSRLDVLTLCDNYLSEDGMRALASSPDLSRLRQIDVSDNRMGGEAIEALLSSPYLAPGTRVLIGGNGVTPKFMETLRRTHAGRLILDDGRGQG